MGLLRPYERKDADTTAEPVSEVAPQTEDGFAGKNRRTPTRREAEAARMAAIHPKLTPKQQKERDRAAEARRQSQAIAAMDDRPERILLRNYIDSRWSLTEFMWPILLVLLALALLGGWVPVLVNITSYLMWGAMLAALLNVIFLWNGYKQELWQRYPGTSTKGLLWAMVQRAITLRRFRNPGAAVLRGQKY